MIQDLRSPSRSGIRAQQTGVRPSKPAPRRKLETELYMRGPDHGEGAARGRGALHDHPEVHVKGVSLHKGAAEEPTRMISRQWLLPHCAGA